MQQARQIGIQQLPQIRIVQSGDETLIESLQASINLTVPVQSAPVSVGFDGTETQVQLLRKPPGHA